MHRTIRRLAQLPVIQLTNATFYRSFPITPTRTPKSIESNSNPPLFENVSFTLPTFPAVRGANPSLWAILASSALVRQTFLAALRGDLFCSPPTARSYPYLESGAVAQHDSRNRDLRRAIQYIGFDEKDGKVPLHGAYLSARYESRREVGDFSLQEYLLGQTELNAAKDMMSYPNDEDFERVVHNMQLRGLLDQPLSHLSHGQSRRAKIARALLDAPEVLLLDCPLNGLDIFTSRKMRDVLELVALAQAPRIVLGLGPTEAIPSWITNIAVLRDNFTLEAMGEKAQVMKELAAKRKTLKQYHRKGTPIPSAEDALFAKEARGFVHRPPTFLGMQNPLWHSDYDHLYLRDYKAAFSYPEGQSKVRSTDGFSKVDKKPIEPGEPCVEINGMRVAYGNKIIIGDWTQKHDFTAEASSSNGLNWTIRRGQRWGLFGPNGSGKTTLISLITSDHPQAYSLPIKVFGKSRLPASGEPGISIFDLQRRIGHSSPEIHALFPRHLTVRRALESAWADAPLLKPRITYEVDRIVDETLRWFRGELAPDLGPTPTVRDEMAPGEARYVSKKAAEEYSRLEIDPTEVNWADTRTFGELGVSAQKVVLFLRAILHRPEIVILDEAFSGMDNFARNRCHLFLSHGQAMIHRFRRMPTKRKLYDSGTKAMKSIMAKWNQVIVPGLSNEQALIVIAHRPDHVPGCVRQWLCLPEPGSGEPPRFGQLDGPMELSINAWRRVWGLKDVLVPREEKRRKREALDPREVRKRTTDRARRRRRGELWEQRQDRLDSYREYWKVRYSPENRKEVIRKFGEANKRWWARMSPEEKRERLRKMAEYQRERNRLKRAAKKAGSEAS